MFIFFWMICLLQERKSLWEGWLQIASSTLALMSSQPTLVWGKLATLLFLLREGSKPGSPKRFGFLWWQKRVLQPWPVCAQHSWGWVPQGNGPQWSLCVRATCFSTCFLCFSQTFPVPSATCLDALDEFLINCVLVRLWHPWLSWKASCRLFIGF